MDEGATLKEQIAQAEKNLIDWDLAHADLMAERKALRQEIASLRRLIPDPAAPAPEATTKEPPKPMIDPRTLEPEITDHALLRYLERHFGFDSDKMRAQLCTHGLRTAVQMGARSVKSEGGRLVLAGNRVVTFLSKKQKGGHQIRKSRPAS